jgi:uncharacterized protein
MHIVIDGYNMIRQSDGLRRYEKSSLEAGRQALVRFLSPYRRAKNHRMTIVFDGWQNGSPREERDREGGMDIIYSRRGRKADDVIKEIAAGTGEELMVVTSDRDIASFVERRGGTAVSSRDFEAIVARRSWERPAGAAAAEGKTEDEDEPGPAGTRKKGPARRISRRERDYLKRVEKL